MNLRRGRVMPDHRPPHGAAEGRDGARVRPTADAGRILAAGKD